MWLCIINILDFSPFSSFRGKSECSDLGLSSSSSSPPPTGPLAHLPHALNASSQLGPSAPEEADWESIAAPAAARGLKGRRTRTSPQTKIIQRPCLICLFLSLYLIWRWKNTHREHNGALSSAHGDSTRGRSSAFFCLCLACEIWSFSASNDLSGKLFSLLFF